MDNDDLLTVAQVAKRLQMNPESITRWIRNGILPAMLLSRRAGYRIRKADLEQFLQGRRLKQQLPV